MSIDTSSGIVNGTKRNIIIYEDIPYAQPPIYELRWKAIRKYYQKLILIQKNNSYAKTI